MWLPEDVEYALAWVAWKAELCGGCGHPKAESMSPDADGAYRAVPLRCHACATRDRAARKMDDQAGLYVALSRD